MEDFAKIRFSRGYMFDFFGFEAPERSKAKSKVTELPPKIVP